MKYDAFSVEKPSFGRFVVSALTISAFAVQISSPTLNLLAVDFANTFQVPVGVTAQLGTINNGAEAVFALIMGFLAIRFKHRLLLLAGILFVSVSAAGCFFAPDFFSLQIFFAMEGIGTVMVTIMGATIIGDSTSLNKKAKAISYITAGTFLATLVGTPIIGFITDIGGWRAVFLFFVLPVSVVGLLVAFFSLPSEPRRNQVGGKSFYLSSFRKVLANRSASAALVGAMLGSATTVALFALSFYREQFSQSLNFTVVVLLVAQSLFVVGSLVAGRLTNRFGSKPLIVIGLVVSGVLTIAFFFMAELWIALTLDMMHVFFSALAFTAGRCLCLDQVPLSRSTMVSLGVIFGSIGAAVGMAVGGALLVLFSYQIVGVAFGAIGLGGACIFYFLTKDPYQNMRN